MADTNDFDVIDPPSSTVKFKGKEVTITPLKVGKIPAFARAIKPVAGAFQSWNEISPAEILDLLAEHGEAIIDAISIASGIERKELEDADAVDLMTLISPIIKANADFFRLRLLLGAAMQQTQQAGSAATSTGAGQTR